MGLIQEMAKQKGARAGVKLPVPTTAGDDQVIAAKTGEYVLPPAVVAAIGVEKLNALVQSITGEAPGGEPAEMPEGPMHEMMEGEMQGHAKGGCVKGMKGYAGGGLISQFDGVRLNADPLQDDRQSLRKYGFDGGMGADSVATEVSRAAQGMPAADEVMQLGMDKMAQKQKPRPNLAQIRELESMGALGEDSNIMGFNNGGLIARMQGYAEGGIVEDDYTRRKLSNYNPQATIRKPEPFSPNANNLRSHYPNASIPPNATTNASPRAPELRNFAPEAGRLQPQSANTYTRMGTEPNAARAPELRNFTPEPGRVQPGATTPRISGLAAPAVNPGLASRAAGLIKAAVPYQVAGAGLAGAAQSFADAGTGYRDEFARSVGAESQMGNVAADAVRTLANVGDAATFGLAGRVGRGLASAAGGGSFGGGFAGPSDRERFARTQGYANGGLVDPDDPLRKALEFSRTGGGQPAMPMGDASPATFQRVPQPATVTQDRGFGALDVGNSGQRSLVGQLLDRTADKMRYGDAAPQPDAASLQPVQRTSAPQNVPQGERAASAAAPQPQSPSFEQKIGKFIADERATPAQAPTAAATTPKPSAPRGASPRAGKGLIASLAPQAPAADPAVMADAQAAQAQLDQSPIARVVGGTGGTMTIQYKDGTTKQVGQEGMGEVNGFYALTSRAARQYDAQPVEVIAGNAGRAQALPEYGYQQVPDAIARQGKAGDYFSGLAQGAIDRVDQVGAEQRLTKFKTDEQIRAANAAPDRGGEGRRLSNEDARFMLDLKKRAVAGDPAAIQQWNMLNGKGASADEYAATSREVPLNPGDPNSPMVKEPVIYNKRTGDAKQSGTQAKRAPYMDGQRLQGPNGKMYVVKNGVPVPEGE